MRRDAISPYILIFRDPPPKNRIFQWTPIVLKFFIFNPTPSFKKVSKFLVKISQFKFLVMTEKIFFVYKLFLSLNISDFSLFFMQKLQPPSKEVMILLSPPFWKFSRRLNSPAEIGGEVVHTMKNITLVIIAVMKISSSEKSYEDVGLGYLCVLVPEHSFIHPFTNVLIHSVHMCAMCEHKVRHAFRGTLKPLFPCSIKAETTAHFQPCHFYNSNRLALMNEWLQRCWEFLFYCLL